MFLYQYSATKIKLLKSNYHSNFLWSIPRGVGWLKNACELVNLRALNTLRQRQDGRHFADDILKCNFLNGNVWIPIKISLKFVLIGPIDNIPALVQIMAWRRPSDKPLSEPMMVSLPTHICVTRPQWVKFQTLNKSRIFQCIDKTICVESQNYPLKLHTKYITYTF